MKTALLSGGFGFALILVVALGAPAGGEQPAAGAGVTPGAAGMPAAGAGVTPGAAGIPAAGAGITPGAAGIPAAGAGITPGMVGGGIGPHAVPPFFLFNPRPVWFPGFWWWDGFEWVWAPGYWTFQ